MENTPTVSILLLGDADVGKSTFLSRLALGRDAPKTAMNELPIYLPPLRDMDQPFSFDIKMYNRPYRFQFYDTASLTSYTLLKPDVIVLCFDINDRPSLAAIHQRWRREVETHFNYNGDMPVMLLGLKRDLRKVDENVIYPQEALAIAQQMRCDRYAECSAVTGELCREVFEDLARMAALTTTENGGQSQGPACLVM